MPSCRTLALAALLVAFPLVAAAQRPSGDPVALAKAGSTALDDHRYSDALESFTAASKLLPSDPGLCVGAGVAAFMMGQSGDAEKWFARALKINARDVNALEWLGMVQYREGHVTDAIATYEAALKQSPDDKDLQDRLDSWRKDAQVEDNSYKANGAHFTVLFHGSADDGLARRVVDRLEAEYFRIGSALNAYPERPITVVLYTDQQFRDVTRLPNWAGGAYDGQIRVPAQGLEDHPDEAGRVLAHEFVHAVVAMLGGRSVPTWLNEGLAVNFEDDGVEKADRVLAAITERPSLKDLQASFATMTSAQARVAYALSAHAVHRIIELRGASAVVMLLQAIGRGVPFSTAFYQCVAMPYDDFQALVARD